MKNEKKLSTFATKPTSLVLQVAIVGIAILCAWQFLAMSSRTYFLIPYNVVHQVTPGLEPFACSYSAAFLIVAFIAGWVVLYWRTLQGSPQVDIRPLLYLSVSCLSFVPYLQRLLGNLTNPPQAWEPIWAVAWTGFSCGSLVQYALASRKAAPTDAPEKQRLYRRLAVATAVLFSFACGVWWNAQSVQHYRDFLLGYNDFGHFLQRVANTAAGRGMLLESPVLPAFWDHFNPGLLALVPLWKIFPTVSLVFFLQAFSLAGSSLLIYSIARQLQHGFAAALAFSLAWLFQPVLGQMNLAYTYGWHPITCAVPLLLGSLLAILHTRYVLAVLLTLAAMSCEEGVIAVVALFAATCCVFSYLRRYPSKARDQATPIKFADTLEPHLTKVSPLAWGSIALASVIGFLLVYRFSGLAEFQTGRFVSLGNSPLEIALSPVLRPTTFWGQLLQFENLVFLALVGIPCGLVNLLRGWRWLLPTLLPLGLLIVWGHRPAQCIAFQYTSSLLPIFWLAAMAGASAKGDSNGSSKGSSLSNSLDFPNRTLPRAVTTLSTALLLSIFFGQLPFSSVTLLDVTAMTYNSPALRKADGDDGKWLHEQVSRVRASGEECLATGRIAAHLVGARDLETVGQYKERREKLAQLPDRVGEPIKHYQWILLDRIETFQQTWIQTAEVETEALAAGFTVVADEYNIVILRKPDSLLPTLGP